MKLTKKIETEVLKVYDTWLQSYLNGDVETYDFYFDDDYHFVGSTNNQEFLNKKDTINFFKTTAHQLAGKSQLRNETKVIEKFEELVFITHLFDALFLNGTDWNYYGRFRFTNALKNNKEGWRFIYQHFSTPDSKAQEEETNGHDKISAENLQLREEVKRRTLELKKKNRELEVETALERIRAQALAMTQSSDLLDIVVTMRNEFIKLGHEAHYFWHMMWLPNKFEKAMTSGDGSKIGMVMELPRDFHGKYQETAAWEKSNEPIHVLAMEAEIAVDYVDRMIKLGNFYQVDPNAPSLEDVRHIGGLTFIMARTSHGEIGYSLPGVVKNPPSGDLEILERFARAFDLAHRRFLDLQKAEAQTKEAKIETALERVRAKGLEMRKTSELQEVVNTLAQQFHNMKMDITGVFIAIANQDIDKEFTFWGSSGVAETYLKKATIPFLDRPIYTVLAKAIGTNRGFFTEEYTREEKIEFFKHLFKYPPFNSSTPEWKEQVLSREGGYTRSVLVSNYTTIFVVNHSGIKLPDSDNEILKRFGKIFEQSYVRFLDLQKAEAQVRESQIATALERVRNRTLTMQKSNELSETSIVVFKQLIELGVEPNRLFIGIIEEGSNKMEILATNEEGSKIANRFIVDPKKNVSINKMYKGWKQKKKSIVIDLRGKILKDYLYYLANEKKIPFKGGLSQKHRIQYIAFFSRGFIGIASPENQPGETLDLLERFAAVFNLTFTRFNDLKISEAHALKAKEDLIKLKTEKKKAEATLTELKSTQSQLIQAEKMASLGELTAGIAHEIQNPLNFVNNFSEVSNEMIQEIKDERSKSKDERDEALQDELLEYISKNLEKISDHGKRADNIVKGMLQHSRINKGEKEPTNINALADEYIRLAYHGLLAKDKSFNVTIKTDYDETIGKLELVPQDIGRVILNLISNAFYAVSERKKRNQEGYVPKLIVNTNKNNTHISISIRDNGVGIPQKNLYKIFEPFFSTKPTGQGTGLGLSLSYDIVKAHGGDLNVFTEVNKGTEFVISLPITN